MEAVAVVGGRQPGSLVLRQEMTGVKKRTSLQKYNRQTMANYEIPLQITMQCMKLIKNMQTTKGRQTGKTAESAAAAAVDWLSAVGWMVILLFDELAG